MNSSFVYIIRSQKDKTFYIGYTKDIDKRLKFHNSGKVRSTKSKTPWNLVHLEKFSNDTEARKREIQLKKSSWHKKQLLDKLT